MTIFLIELITLTFATRIYFYRIILFVYLLPLFTLLIFNFTIGQTPEPLNIGIINNEISSHCTYQSSDICNPEIPISCKYAYEMEKHQLILVSTTFMIYAFGRSLTIYLIRDSNYIEHVGFVSAETLQRRGIGEKRHTSQFDLGLCRI